MLVIAVGSLVVCFLGQSAYELLETAYAIGMVGLFVPLTLGLMASRGTEKAALASMLTGIGVWGLHLFMGWESFGGSLLGDFYLPQELAATLLAWLAYELVAQLEPRLEPAV